MTNIEYLFGMSTDSFKLLNANGRINRNIANNVVRGLYEHRDFQQIEADRRQRTNF